MSQTYKLPTFPVQVLAECRVHEHPWRKEDVSQDVRFRPPWSGASWPERFDGREYLDAVMRVATPEHMLRFLNEYGDPGSHSTVPVSKRVPMAGFAGEKPKDVLMTSYKSRGYMDFSQFQEMQQVLRKAAELPVEKWEDASIRWFNVGRLKVQLDFEEGHLTGECVVDPGVAACAAQLFFEKLSGAEYAWCARSDCNKFFRLESKHSRKFCLPDCAHVVAVRASRDRKQRRAKKAQSLKVNEERKR